jgi:hypothetical protein
MLTSTDSKTVLAPGGLSLKVVESLFRFRFAFRFRFSFLSWNKQPLVCVSAPHDQPWEVCCDPPPPCPMPSCCAPSRGASCHAVSLPHGVRAYVCKGCNVTRTNQNAPTCGGALGTEAHSLVMERGRGGGRSRASTARPSNNVATCALAWPHKSPLCAGLPLGSSWCHGY